MITLQIKDRAVAVIDADEEQARELAEDDVFQEDLKAMTSEGQSLWNGVDPLVIRPSTKDEIALGEDALDDEDWGDDEDEEDGVEGGVSILFLLPIDDDEDEPAPGAQTA
jgi:hypothetical protein